jgi:hypothetical protein
MAAAMPLLPAGLRSQAKNSSYLRPPNRLGSVVVSGVHAQTLGVPPPPQVSGAAQEPQSSVSPQPSAMVPQVAPCSAHVAGAHVG